MKCDHITTKKYFFLQKKVLFFSKKKYFFLVKKSTSCRVTDDTCLKINNLKNQVGMDTAEVDSTEKGDEY